MTDNPYKKRDEGLKKLAIEAFDPHAPEYRIINPKVSV